MTVSLVGTPEVKSSFTDLLSFTVPGTAAADDLVVVITASTQWATMSPSVTMTTIGPLNSEVSGSAAETYVFIATVAEVGGAGASFTVGEATSSNNMCAGMAVFHSSTGDPLGYFPTDTSCINITNVSASGATAPDIALAHDGVLLFGGSVKASSANTYTPPTGYTEHDESSRAWASLELASKSVSAGGTSGTATNTSTASGQNSGVHLLIYEDVVVDATPPTVTLDDPTPAGQTADYEHVAGTVEVTWTAADETLLDRVDLYLDDVLLQASATSPYSWATPTTSNGSHTLKATAVDAATNEASDSVTVVVNNDGRWGGPGRAVTPRHGA